MHNMTRVDSSAASEGPDRFPDKPDADHTARLNASDRLRALMTTGLLESAKEEAFDRITRLATRLLGVEVSLMSLVDERRQFFKAADGLVGEYANQRETPLSHSFCQYVVTADKALAVHDSRSHPMLKDNLASHEMGVIAYLGEPIHAPDGQPIGSLCAIHSTPRLWSMDDQQTMRDLAAIVENELRARADAQRSVVLLLEMQHRVKNLFTVSSSLMRMSARNAVDKDDLVEILQGRLRALSLAHDLALGDAQVIVGDGSDLADLLDVALAPYRRHADVTIEIEGPSVSVASDALTYLSLSIHELATNAAKYGALSGTEGALSVSWEVNTEHLSITWQETVAVESTDQTPGFGSSLLENAVVIGLGGAFKRELSPTGLLCTLELPVAILKKPTEIDH